MEKKGASFTYILMPFSDPGRYQVVICLMLLFGNNNAKGVIQDVIQKRVGLPMAWIAQFNFYLFLFFKKLTVSAKRGDASKQAKCPAWLAKKKKNTLSSD